MLQIVKMKGLATLLLLVAVTAGYKIQKREKRFFLGYCDVDSDCGNPKERCCSNFGTCHDKRGLDESCNFVNIHGCECKDDLSCQAVYSIGSLHVYFRCRPIPTEAPGSGTGDF